MLTSLDHPVNKKFSLDDSGEVKKSSFQNAYYYDVETTAVAGIEDLTHVIEACSVGDKHILIRGSPSGQRHRVQKLKDNFPEHPEGVPWVMLDFDNIVVPDGVNPLSVEAIEWVITKLPVGFHNVSFFYQHSASAGVLRSDGEPMKCGLNVHLFFWLDRRVPGKDLNAWLIKHCIDTGFYVLDANNGGDVQLTPGVDPAPIRSSVQAHFIAAPTIDEGVRCSLDPEQRQGLVRKAKSSVGIPGIDADIEAKAKQLKAATLDDYKRQHGYRTKTMMTTTAGKVAVTRYSVPTRDPSQPPQTGRQFVGAQSNDENFLTLYFADEGTPGSWFVCKDRPQLAYRHGDASCLPLRELSLGAHEYVRDELRWFSEVPHRNMALTGGYLPAISEFARAKISLVLAPTGSGKTTAAIHWIRSRIEGGQVVMYAAPTIALVKQMQDELMNAGLSPAYYRDAWGPNFPRSGVVVTTNDSLPRLVKEAYANNVPHCLILDEIHQGLDRFMGSRQGLADLESALSKSRQSLLLTGTLTDVQRHALVDVAHEALGTLNESDYCCYEFDSVKSNPLEVRPTAHFDSDLASLLEDFGSKLDDGESLPRFVMLLDTSRMEMYRRLIDQYGLSEHAHIVSRQEDSEGDIELARTSTQPILISSPLFGLGLNFARQPDILWARFDHVKADTNQIIQAVNRANRGEQPCQVRIYGNVLDNEELSIPEKARLKEEIRELLQDEASLAGLLEEHLHLDRVTYNELRKAERDSSVALSTLVRRNAIQNFMVVECTEVPAIDKAKARIVKQARSAARIHYKQLVVDAAANSLGSGTLLTRVRLERLNDERKSSWRSGEPRTERDFQNETSAIFMSGFGIANPSAAQSVNPAKVQRLFGDSSPWVSSQYSRGTHQGWAKVEAEKTDKLIVLLEKLGALKNEEIAVDDLSASLTKGGRLGDAFLALVNNDSEFQSVSRRLLALKSARQNVRTKGGARERARVRIEGLELLRELLEPLGVTYGTKASRGRQVTDITKPIIPEMWDLNEMILTLRRQSAMLGALPGCQRVPVLPTEEEPLFTEIAIPRQICETCVFFRQNACSRGRLMDWQSSGRFDADIQCDAFKGMKVELRLE
ncbi:DEAD/DEAH box helicase [Paraburkholderia tropica]|uniref:DEAD/DEAH box helicase n=1 Tax=Paraburkholderia tropica TaxID=92647 RepID=UPI001F1A94B9|nr:DEAD/DEAH box helicase family protein [Paraburkholderia tropica]